MFGVSRTTSWTVARSSRSSLSTEIAVADCRCGRALRQHPRHHRIALLRAGHRLHHVARERRMQIAEEADRASHPRESTSAPATCRRLGDALRLHRIAVFVDGLELLAVERNVVRVLARQHRVGLRAGRDQNRARRQRASRAGLVQRAVSASQLLQRQRARHGRI